MCSSADTRATANDFASGRCGRPSDCHGFCAEREGAHKLRQLHASRETSASFGAIPFPLAEPRVSSVRSSNDLKRTQPLPMSSFLPLFLYWLVNQVERVGPT